MIKITTNKKDLIVLLNHKQICYFAKNTIPNATLQTNNGISSTSGEIFEYDVVKLADNSTMSIIIADYDMAIDTSKLNIDFLDTVVKIELPKNSYEFKVIDIIKNVNDIKHYCNAIWICDIDINVKEMKIHYNHICKQFQLTDVDPTKILKLDYLQDDWDSGVDENLQNIKPLV